MLVVNSKTRLKDVEHDKDAQLMRVWIEASGYLYSDIRRRAYEKFNNYGS